MDVQVISSPTGAYWHITVDGTIVEGAPKRGHGSATRKQMVQWADDIRRGLRA